MLKNRSVVNLTKFIKLFDENDEILLILWRNVRKISGATGVVFVYISQQREKIYYFICFNTLFSILRFQLATFDIVRYSSSPIKCQEVWNNVIEVKSDNKELNVNFTVLILFNCALWSNSWQSKVCINCKMEYKWSSTPGSW